MDRSERYRSNVVNPELKKEKLRLLHREGYFAKAAQVHRRGWFPLEDPLIRWIEPEDSLILGRPPERRASFDEPVNIQAETLSLAHVCAKLIVAFMVSSQPSSCAVGP